MSEGMVRKWVRMFNEGRENVHDEERSGSPSLITEELVLCIDEKVRSNRRFTISDLSMNFQNISRSLLHEIVKIIKIVLAMGTENTNETETHGSSLGVFAALCDRRKWFLEKDCHRR
ncbi:hypothetical protein AVEN_30887-1 [Araneus ventricosus]|uniref:Mos1 transposase HTH domain-containing protein n=1 Tax=Araneus ventricosus TaxID=182803 RepID=A0A4Y2W735_ARAVE|nr:hypothetical protein AVEN_42566-1 [Araneus ventricosus]GBO33941.1 hypothetical protein AVEN_30887-1 [Araneus ventricosus]